MPAFCCSERAHLQLTRTSQTLFMVGESCGPFQPRSCPGRSEEALRKRATQVIIANRNVQRAEELAAAIGPQARAIGLAELGAQRSQLLRLQPHMYAHGWPQKAAMHTQAWERVAEC